MFLKAFQEANGDEDRIETSWGPFLKEWCFGMQDIDGQVRYKGWKIFPEILSLYTF